MANLGFYGGIHVRHAEHGTGMGQKQDTRHGEQHGQPETLLENARDLVVTPGAVQVGDDRRNRLHDADQRKDN